MFIAVLKGISDGLSRGKKPDEMEKLVELWILVYLYYSFNSFSLYLMTCWIYKVKDLWKANMTHPPASEFNKDLISHFVLRLVYCRT